MRAGPEDVGSRQLGQRREGPEHQGGGAPQGRLLLHLPDGLRPADAERQPSQGPGDQLDRALPGGALLAVLQGLRAGLPPAHAQGDRQANRSRSTPSTSPTTARSAAWKSYVKKYNDGRDFVLLGHSQGSFTLRKLDRRPDRRQQGASQAHALRDPARRQRQRRPGVRRQAGGARGLQAHQALQVVHPAPLRDGLLDLQRAGAARTRSSGARRAGPQGALHQPGGARRRLRAAEGRLPVGSVRSRHDDRHCDSGRRLPAARRQHAVRGVRRRLYGHCSSADGASVLQIAPEPDAPTLHPIPTQSGASTWSTATSPSATSWTSSTTRSRPRSSGRDPLSPAARAGAGSRPSPSRRPCA